MGLVKQTGGAQASCEMMAHLPAMGRIAMPKEVAHLIVGLCAPGGSLITGAADPIDGGCVAQ